MRQQSLTYQNLPNSHNKHHKNNKKQKKDTKEIISKIDNKITKYQFSINNTIITHLNLSLFKTQPCRYPREHNKIKCPFFHSSRKDYRRNPNVYRYSSFICMTMKKGKPFCDRQGATVWTDTTAGAVTTPSNSTTIPTIIRGGSASTSLTI